MCGIAGKASSRGRVAEGLVEAMCDREVHRGPDSRGIHSSDGISLGIASELQALMADGDIPRAIDPTSIDCYLAYGYIPAPWSIWRGVKKLPPAHTLVWEDGSATLDRYWSLDYSRKRTESQPELE